MPDYGHPLRFGTFIQPSNQQPERTIALAELSERLGYDLGNPGSRRELRHRHVVRVRGRQGRGHRLRAAGLRRDDTAGFFERWGAAVEAAPREVTSFVILGPPRGGQPAVAHVMVAVDSADADTVLARLQPLAEIAPLVGSDAQITSYATVMANASPDPHQGQGEPVTRSGLIRHITPEFAVAIEKLMATGIVYFFQIRSLGGAVGDIAAGATAFGTRDANFAVVAFGTDRARLDEAWEDIYQHFRGLYLSFETDTRAERLSDAFPAATLERLRALKHRYDPGNVFRDNFNIAPSPGLG